ncbi:hypothetical protein [Jannaschia aquimarina]|uniref:Glycosyltransferase RgtA/B/C/D-like domain-containing protein n=1 Tax=Jannaschia aquimarina TaxID=935700 RepID=A0A0D1ELU8_9RHOB|nr:hypothetical protein [Jannaschia aquimarina]KIT16715.1 hypothetical protein jaqu_15030 [Jannaschia aquimarina]SNS54347.1 Dolichyl-phosphate-mannose-protein mannosyltransferase [Jannaschia aquimarina]
MTLPERLTGQTPLLVLSVAILAISVLASPGFFNVDEVVYFIGADALWRLGSLTVENGVAGVTSPDLRIMLLIDGPAGLAPQYPAGTAIFGALLTPIFGQSSLIALNVAAGIGTLFATRSLALRLFGSEPVATGAVLLLVFATFWAEYVVGHWPHSVSVFMTTLALVLYLDSARAEHGAWRLALLSGLAIGLGMLFRLDGILILPVIAAAAILWAARPVQVLAGGAAGLAAPIALLSYTNAIKFGTWNPLSYGSSGGGGTDFTTHLTAGSLVLLILGGLVVLRIARPLSRRAVQGTALLGVLAIAAAGLVAPQTVMKFWAGIDGLFLDATAIPDRRAGIVPQPDGTLSFWGFHKKALLQSLPWLGCAALLLVTHDTAHRRSLIFVLLLLLVWLAPFVMRTWHGGLGSNMRYFLPTVPAMAALGAYAISRLASHVPGRAIPLLLTGVVLGVTMTILLGSALPSGDARLHQIASTRIFGLIAICALVAALLPRRATAMVALAATGIGIGTAAKLAYDDFDKAQDHRSFTAQASARLDDLSEPVLYFGAPETFTGAFSDPMMAVAHPERPSHGPDPTLVEGACKAGYRVLISEWLAGEGGLNLAELRPAADLRLEDLPPVLHLPCQPRTATTLPAQTITRVP